MTQIPVVCRRLPNPAATKPLARQRSPFPAPAGKTLHAAVTVLEGEGMLFHVFLTPDPEGCSVLRLRTHPAQVLQHPLCQRGHGSAQKSLFLYVSFHMRGVVRSQATTAVRVHSWRTFLLRTAELLKLSLGVFLGTTL